MVVVADVGLEVGGEGGEPGAAPFGDGGLLGAEVDALVDLSLELLELLAGLTLGVRAALAALAVRQ